MTPGSPRRSSSSASAGAPASLPCRLRPERRRAPPARPPPTGSCTRMLSTPSDSKPGSNFASAAKLRPNSAAPTSSVTVTAICPATITCSVRPLLPPRAFDRALAQILRERMLAHRAQRRQADHHRDQHAERQHEQHRAPVDAGRREARQLHRAERQQRVAGPQSTTGCPRCRQAAPPTRSRTASSEAGALHPRRSRAAARTRGGVIRCAPAAGWPRWRTRSPARTPPRRTAARSPAGSGRTLRSPAATLRRRASRWSAGYACASCLRDVGHVGLRGVERHAGREPRERRESAVAALRLGACGGVDAIIDTQTSLASDRPRERRRRDADDREDLVVELNRSADRRSGRGRTRAPTSARRSPPTSGAPPRHLPASASRPSSGSTPSIAKYSSGDDSP